MNRHTELLDRTFQIWFNTVREVLPDLMEGLSVADVKGIRCIMVLTYHTPTYHIGILTPPIPTHHTKDVSPMAVVNIFCDCHVRPKQYDDRRKYKQDHSKAKQLGERLEQELKRIENISLVNWQLAFSSQDDRSARALGIDSHEYTVTFPLVELPQDLQDLYRELLSREGQIQNNFKQLCQKIRCFLRETDVQLLKEAIELIERIKNQETKRHYRKLQREIASYFAMPPDVRIVLHGCSSQSLEDRLKVEFRGIIY